MEENRGRKNYLLKELPISLRPRERLEEYGSESLSDTELLAIIIRTGTADLSALSVAESVLHEFDNLSSLSTVTVEELCKIKGIHKVKAITILAALELGKRVVNNFRKKIGIIKRPGDAYMCLRTMMENLEHEELVCIFLNIKSEIIKIKRLTTGTINSTLFEPKDILKWALKYSSSFIIIAHNHPSGDVSPSENDKIVTERLIAAAKLIDIKVVDHIIIGKGNYYSFLENKSKY